MTDSSKAKALFDLGFESFTNSDFANAVKNFKAAEASTGLDETRLNQLLAESLLETGDFAQAKEYFLKANMPSQAAFAMILNGELDEAKKIYEAAVFSLGRKWGLFLCDFLGNTADVAQAPGFLTFRLMFESTVTYFIRFSLDHYLERFLLNTKQLESYFPELKKCIGSAHLSLANYELAENFLLQAKKLCPQDAEVYYKLGEVYLLTKQNDKAKKCFQEVIAKLPGHRASIKYLEKMAI